MIVSAMIPGSELFTVESNNTNATTPRSVALVATDRLDGCGALSEMVLKKDHRILHLISGRCVYPKGTQHNIWTHNDPSDKSFKWLCVYELISSHCSDKSLTSAFPKDYQFVTSCHSQVWSFYDRNNVGLTSESNID